MSNLGRYAPRGDQMLAEMRSARQRPASLKTKLANFKTSFPGRLVFVFEGVDDIKVYEQWIGRIRPPLVYEPFCSLGKDALLALYDSLDRDLGNVREGVYFFVDRDFDDLRGRVANASIFMPEAYSIENYLVCEQVLEKTLKTEFNCLLDPAERSELMQKFRAQYCKFLELTKPVNYRIYIARKNGVSVRPLPVKMSDLCKMTIDGPEALVRQPEQIVEFCDEGEPRSDLESAHRAEFEGLNPTERYRGKFSLMFFMRWLQLHAEDRNSETPKCFKSCAGGTKVRHQEITIALLASKAPPPERLEGFVEAI